MQERCAELEQAREKLLQDLESVFAREDYRRALQRDWQGALAHVQSELLCLMPQVPLGKSAREEIITLADLMGHPRGMVEVHVGLDTELCVWVWRYSHWRLNDYWKVLAHVTATTSLLGWRMKAGLELVGELHDHQVVSLEMRNPGEE